MKYLTNKSLVLPGVSLLLLVALFAVSIVRTANAGSKEPAHGEKLLVIHDGTSKRGFLTKAETIREALEDADIPVDANDLVEPRLDEELIASNYDVNIYRARPVIIVDGAVRKKIMSAYRTPSQIVEHAGMELRQEDNTTMGWSVNPFDGVVAQLTIDRATPLTLVLYGTRTTVYTQAETVADFLKEKSIVLGDNDKISVSSDERITTDMVIELWREGRQTITVEEDVEFDIEQIQDVDREVGYREITVPGVPGKQSVTYEIEIRNGVEVSRKEIQKVLITEPKNQVEIIGMKTSGNPLTKAKGVNFFTDSKGILHRETYYDLPMGVVMNNCGMGGYYIVRADGAKIDRDGYVIVAAHLGNYPRCSIVETSMGLGKVYDTGGFVARHPHGFDLATDWTKADGI